MTATEHVIGFIDADGHAYLFLLPESK